MPRYEFKEGTSSKFWEISQEGESITTRWGRLGTEGQEKKQDFDSRWEAKRQFAKLIAEKEKKGYKRVATREDGPQPKSNPELEAAILKNPDSPDGFLVYGDWLQSQGDARGEIVALQHAALKAKGAQATTLKKQLSKLLAKHELLLLGTRLAKAVQTKWLSVDWHLGFIQKARIAATHEAESDLDVGEILEVLLKHPSARFLRELTIGLETTDGDAGYGGITKIIAKHAPKTVERLFLGDFEFPDENEISWTDVGNISPLCTALPGLRSLRLRGGSLALKDVDFPELREFTIETGGLPRPAVKAIVAAKWPKLERLEIWFGNEEYGAGGKVEDLAPLLEGTGLSNLRHLGLRNSEFADALCKVLPTAKILPQLESLDLSMGIMTAEGAEALLKNAAAFKHLKRLDVTENLLDRKTAASLSKLSAEVLYKSQRDDDYDPEDEYSRRYVAVGE